MSLPEPLLPLKGACSVIFDNTLYSYSSAGFESLKLEDGAQWEKLASGHSVEGGVCVGTTPKDSSKAALFVVGGKSKSSDYAGLQKFTYKTKKWEAIAPEVNVTQNRVYHSAAYIQGSDSILVYSGSTDGNPSLSSQTFTVGASEPYEVLAFQSTLSPPGIAPIILPWSDTQAVMLGGNPTNTRVMLFDPVASWIDPGITLAEPLPKNSTFVKAAIIDGDDGSKHLYTFDMSTSPNTVNRTMLSTGGGLPIAGAAPVRESVSSRDLQEGNDAAIEKRALTEDNWPKYNSTLAPRSTRNDYSIATDSNGLVVISGGNDDEVLCMFNAKQNTWKNATAVFGQQKGFSIQSTPESSSSVSSSFSSTATSFSTSTSDPIVAATTDAISATPTPTPAPQAENNSLEPTTLLGIVLGTIFGFAFVLMCLLFWMKHLRKRQNHADAGHAPMDRGISDEKSGFDQEFAKDPGGHFKGHVPQDSVGSFSSMAILMGKVPKSAMQPQGNNEMKRNSTNSIFNKQFKSTIGRPQPQEGPEPDFLSRDEKGVAFAADLSEPKPRPRPAAPDSGDDTMRRSSGWNRYWSGGSALSVFGLGNGNSQHGNGSEPSSFYSNKNRLTQDSATVPALSVPSLQVPQGRAELNYVNSSSPTISQHNLHIGEGLSGQIERPISTVSSSGYSSGIPPSVHDTWDPTTMKKAWGDVRAPSSTYSQSVYQTVLGPPGASGPPTGISSQPPQVATASNSNDLSWLNLGDNNNNQPFK
ncbi:uncharacterized protein F4812DRAFT_105135 [Daldinia caldariorum]|uniref:uncharacterized protein n=1 Tax=Daldinia caldariorum TaxID=326644 RepID=UPI0020083FBD|nr:uncharacterized protein F4812DRAFT_105135 [Daldinia caldariorum]KAI1465642.1 hypothetical protein F4812DRAFT_105135 [Daldinia caldariorum]